MERKVTAEEIMERLESYRDKKNRVVLLEHEKRSLPSVSADEIMEGMALSRPHFSIRTSEISDRTMNIALCFRDKASKLNNDLRAELADELMPLYTETEELELLVGLLPSYQSKVIRARYFESMSWNEIAKMLHKSTRTLYRWHDAAVQKLMEYYQHIIDRRP